MLANIQTALMWIGGVTVICLALLPIIAIFTTPTRFYEDEAHGDTTGYDRTGKDWRP